MKTKTTPAKKKAPEKAPQPKRPVARPEQLTDFGRYLEAKGLSYASAGADLGITRSYAQMLATGAATPQLVLAGKIELWSGSKVRMQSWLPHCPQWPGIRATVQPIEEGATL
jgi:hypothetical protein